MPPTGASDILPQSQAAAAQEALGHVERANMPQANVPAPDQMPTTFGPEPQPEPVKVPVLSGNEMPTAAATYTQKPDNPYAVPPAPDANGQWPSAVIDGQPAATVGGQSSAPPAEAAAPPAPTAAEAPVTTPPTTQPRLEEIPRPEAVTQAIPVSDTDPYSKTYPPVPEDPATWKGVGSTPPEAAAALSPEALAAEAASPEGQRDLEALKTLGENPAATLAAATELARTNDQKGLKAIAPALQAVLDRITK